MTARRSILAMALLASCGDAQAAGGHGEPPPALVEVAPGREGALAIERRYLGMVRSVARAELAAEAGGQVLEVTVREGDRVEAGQLLVRVDAEIARADLSAARASAAQVQTQQSQAAADALRFARAGPSTVAQLEIERAGATAAALSAQRDGVRAQVARARESLSRTRIVAPFAGVIAARRVDPGDWVSPGTAVLELVADAETEVLVRVEPELLEDIAVGTPATLLRGDEALPATVAGVVRALDPATRTAQVRLRPDGQPSWLLAGGAVNVRFALEHDGDGVLVPRDALVPGVAQTRVVRVVDGLAQPVLVEVVERGTTEVRVRGEGLSASDVFVVRGNDRLRSGQPVRVDAPSEPEAEPETAPAAAPPTEAPATDPPAEPGPEGAVDDASHRDE